MNKNISRSKLFFAFLSLIITFFVWQQGLKESLERPSVSFDQSQGSLQLQMSSRLMPLVAEQFHALQTKHVFDLYDIDLLLK